MCRFTPLKSRPLKGFNLIEAAIVLGVVGLVIGGIWAAAASYNFHRRQQQYFQGLLTLKTNVQRLITFSQTCNPGNYLHNTAPDLQTQLWPAEWTALGATEFGTPSLSLECDANNITYLQANWNDWDPNFTEQSCTLLVNYIYNRHDPDMYVSGAQCFSWAQGAGISIKLNH